MELSPFTTQASQSRITSYNVCYTKLLRACEGDKKNGSPLVYGTYELGEALTTHDGNKAYALDTKLYASHGDEPLTCFGIVSVDGNKLYFGDTTRTNESGVSLDCSKPNRRPDMLHFDVAFQHID